MTDAEQHGGRNHAALRRFADAEEKQRDPDHQRADQKRYDGRQHEVDGIGWDRRRQHADEMHGPDADGEERGGARQQHATAHARRPADACREAETGVTTQDRDHHRERDEIGIVSCEHDLLGRPSPRAKPPPTPKFIDAAAEMTIELFRRASAAELHLGPFKCEEVGGRSRCESQYAPSPALAGEGWGGGCLREY